MTRAFEPTVPWRNCFRCGSEFRSEGTDRICSRCRPVKSIKKPFNPTLSFREKQVVRLVSEAKLNKEIAFELHLAEGTIKEYLNRIFRKVGANNRTELAIWALKNDFQRADGRVSSGAHGAAFSRQTTRNEPFQ